MYDYEHTWLSRGHRYVGGVDEAGRGPLAGPVVAACVILDPGAPIDGLNDSKQLSDKVRRRLTGIIKARALAYHVTFIDEKTIDDINIYQASKLAMQQAIGACDPRAEVVLSDAMPLDLDIPCDVIIKGDTKSASIAAASILAKTARDDYMIALAADFPQYGFDRHKGYPTKQHIEALNLHGVTRHHRRSYKPVKDALQKQLSLDLEASH